MNVEKLYLPRRGRLERGEPDVRICLLPPPLVGQRRVVGADHTELLALKVLALALALGTELFLLTKKILFESSLGL